MSTNDPSVLRLLDRIESAVLRPTLEGLQQYHSDEKEPGLTIFVPNWNQRSFLPRAIRSALATLDELGAAGVAGELLVVDDASRDGSPRLLRSLEKTYADPRLLTLFLDANLGLPRLRNSALGLARYRFIVFLDADNELVPENMSTFFRAINETGAAIVYGNLLDRQGNDIVGLRSNNMATMDLFDENYIDAFALCDVEQLRMSGGYVTHPQLYGWEDWELILHLASEGSEIIFVPAVMGFYSINPRSMLRETNERVSERLEVMRRVHAPAGLRGWDPRKIGRIYHPTIGFLEDQWEHS